MGRLSQEQRARLVAALIGAALVATASYALQRLWDARTEPPMGTVVAQAVIPYFWRLGITALHALGAGSLLFFGLSPAGADRLVAAAPWLAPLVALPAMLAMMAVP